MIVTVKENATVTAITTAGRGRTTMMTETRRERVMRKDYRDKEQGRDRGCGDPYRDRGGTMMNEIVQGTVETTGNFDGPIMNPSIANFTRVSYSGSWVSEPAFGGFVKAEDTGVWPVPWTNGAMARRPTKEWGENAGCQTHDVEVSLRM
ncbi:hypothetical protein JVT61DRAFT_9413 [Boletus reticuloceps]|uniref:Uncharacterized protein n=1 Tax=Boletus reticuloceps TaxID=495285 RepID=A0A8I3A6C0_9AGAM|nr:hypothetical protein JVT61DRAFT_9413 [Boletus reticuloceps]